VYNCGRQVGAGPREDTELSDLTFLSTAFIMGWNEKAVRELGMALSQLLH